MPCSLVQVGVSVEIVDWSVKAGWWLHGIHKRPLNILEFTINVWCKLIYELSGPIGRFAQPQVISSYSRKLCSKRCICPHLFEDQLHNYLSESVNDVLHIARFKARTDYLRIETGSWATPRIVPEERACPVCMVVEDYTRFYSSHYSLHSLDTILHQSITLHQG